MKLEHKNEYFELNSLFRVAYEILNRDNEKCIEHGSETDIPIEDRYRFVFDEYVKKLDTAEIQYTSETIEEIESNLTLIVNASKSYLLGNIEDSLNYAETIFKKLEKTIFLNKGFGTESLSNKVVYFNSSDKAKFYMATLNSNLFWWYYALNFDMFNLKDYMIFSFRLNYESDFEINMLSEIMESDLNKNKQELIVNSATRVSFFHLFIKRNAQSVLLIK